MLNRWSDFPKSIFAEIKKLKCRHNAYLLLSLEKARQVVCVDVVFEVAVGEHEEVQIPAGRHHLVEGAELLEAQRSLVVICVCFLHSRYKKWF